MSLCTVTNPHTLGFLCYLLNVSSIQPTFDHSCKILTIPRRCGYANSWGVSRLRYYSLTRIVDAYRSPCYAYQVFQDYYENVLLKGTSPSTMCALSIFKR